MLPIRLPRFVLRCPHTDQPPLEVTWFRGRVRCTDPVQVPKHSFDTLVASGAGAALVCFECWTSADSNAKLAR